MEGEEGEETGTVGEGDRSKCKFNSSVRSQN